MLLSVVPFLWLFRWFIWQILLNFGVSQQKSCPVRVFSNGLLNGNGPNETSGRLLRQFGPNSDTQMGQGSTEMPWQNNTALLFSEHFEPEAENSLMANYKCQFIFVGAPDEKVQIIFHFFRLRQRFPLNSRQSQNVTTKRCEENDHLSAHVLLSDRMSKIHDFCGDELPAQLMSAKNVLTLTYVLKSAFFAQNPTQNTRKWAGDWRLRERDETEDEHFGWIAEYRFIKDFGAQPIEAIASADDGSKGCSFVFNGTIKKTGNVWSPNYPGFYPRNVDCQYVFIGRPDQKVYITFEYFDVEGFGHCEESTQSDFVLFSNYKTRDRTNRRFCGQLRPKGAVQSESNYFRMQFHTNAIFDGTGFYARYQFLHEKPLKSRVKLAPTGGGAKGGRIWTKNKTIILSMLFLIMFW
ncbi:hypothetical protein niasHT_015633 [Heterodera trifolii]|uniref:CUB domain-containing protein n=1 Tax=Heterodera trifolii TaxID=157864 RepID=A0ABD2L475_9BILA